MWRENYPTKTPLYEPVRAQAFMPRDGWREKWMDLDFMARTIEAGVSLVNGLFSPVVSQFENT